MKNQWTFRGLVIDVQARQTAKGSTVHSIVLQRPDDEDAGKMHHCICETWHDTVPAMGQVIQAEGKCAAREYQGKWYPTFALTSWFRVAIDDELADEQLDHAEQKRNAYQPQAPQPIPPPPEDKQPGLPVGRDTDNLIPF